MPLRWIQTVLIGAIAATTGAAAFAVLFAPPPAGQLPPVESYWLHKYFYERNVGKPACRRDTGASLGRITDAHYGEWREPGESNGGRRWIYTVRDGERSAGREAPKTPERVGVRIASIPAALVTVSEGRCVE